VREILGHIHWAEEIKREKEKRNDIGKTFVAPSQDFPVLEVTHTEKEQQQALRSWNNRAGHRKQL
jgi:hypothetical protein